MDPRLNEGEAKLRASAAAAADELIRPHAAAIDFELRLPEGLLASLGERRLLAAGLPGAAGSEGGLLDFCLVIEQVARASASVAAALVSHHVATRALAVAAWHAEALGSLAVGERLAAFAIGTAGSPLREPAVALRASADGQRLEGDVEAVTGAAFSDILLAPALVDGAPALFVVAADADGLEIGEEEPKLGLNGSGSAPVRFDGVEAERVGDSADLGELLDVCRLGYAATSVGLAQAALDAALEAARQDDALGAAQPVQWMLADCATETEAGRLLTWYAASRPVAELTENAAMARLVASEAAVAASRRAVQVLGDRGARRALGVERLYRDAKVLEVHAGASEAQRRAVVRRLMPDLIDADGD